MFRQSYSLIVLCIIASGCVASSVSTSGDILSDVAFDSVAHSDIPDGVRKSLAEQLPNAEIESRERGRDRNGRIIYRLTVRSGSMYFFDSDGTFLGVVI